MRILLTGSHGFIGTHFRQDAPDDFEFVNVDFKVDRPVSQVGTHDLLGVDAIVHLAAHISVPHSWDDPVMYAHNNALLTLDLVKKAVDHGIKKFIFASSSSVYTEPPSPYGASKRAAEEFLKCYAKDIEIVILRFFNVYGSGQNRDYAGVITKFMQALRAGEPMTIYGDGMQTRDFTFVKDIVKVLVNACQGDGSYDEPIDIGTGQAWTIKDLARMMQETWKQEVPIIYADDRGEARFSRANTRRGRELLLSFTPLPEGLKKLYAGDS